MDPIDSILSEFDFETVYKLSPKLPQLTNLGVVTRGLLQACIDSYQTIPYDMRYQYGFLATRTTDYVCLQYIPYYVSADYCQATVSVPVAFDIGGNPLQRALKHITLHGMRGVTELLQDCKSIVGLSLDEINLQLDRHDSQIISQSAIQMYRSVIKDMPWESIARDATMLGSYANATALEFRYTAEHNVVNCLEPRATLQRYLCSRSMTATITSDQILHIYWAPAFAGAHVEASHPLIHYIHDYLLEGAPNRLFTFLTQYDKLVADWGFSYHDIMQTI